MYIIGEYHTVYDEGAWTFFEPVRSWPPLATTPCMSRFGSYPLAKGECDRLNEAEARAGQDHAIKYKVIMLVPLGE